jgi:hypothetical protein
MSRVEASGDTLSNKPKSQVQEVSNGEVSNGESSSILLEFHPPSSETADTSVTSASAGWPAPAWDDCAFDDCAFAPPLPSNLPQVREQQQQQQQQSSSSSSSSSRVGTAPPRLFFLKRPQELQEREQAPKLQHRSAAPARHEPVTKAHTMGEREPLSAHKLTCKEVLKELRQGQLRREQTRTLIAQYRASSTVRDQVQDVLFGSPVPGQ